MSFFNWIIFIISFWITLFVCIWLLSQMVYPIIYSLPKSIAALTRGEVRWTILINCIAPPLFWTGVLIGLGFVLARFVPVVLDYLLSDPGVQWGQIAAMVVILAAPLRRKRRDDLRSDYYAKTYCKHLTARQQSKYESFASMLPEATEDMLLSWIDDEQSNYLYKILAFQELSKRHLQGKKEQPNETLI